MDWMLTLLGGVLGLVIGSFVNLVLDRLPLMWATDAHRQHEQDERFEERLRQHLREQTLSLSRPARSFCFSCGHQLRWWENLPVMSFLLQRGRCRSCGQGYGVRTLVVEAGHGGVYALLWGVVSEPLWALWVSFGFSFWASLGYLSVSGMIPPVGKRPLLIAFALIHLGSGVLLLGR